MMPPTQAASGSSEPEATFLGYSVLTWQKIIPLGLMFFSILFNYTILRDTKVRGETSDCRKFSLLRAIR